MDDGRQHADCGEGLGAAEGADGRIYAIGGINYIPTDSPVDTVEAYAPGTNTWTTVASMPTARGFVAAAVGADGRIYVIGGCNGTSILNTGEAYTPGSNTWTTIASMPTARFFLAAAKGEEGSIYAIGGDDSHFDKLSTVEAYSPQTSIWTTVASILVARDGLGTAECADGHIYAIGGRNSTWQSVNTVEALGFAGVATFTTSSLPVGNHTITAVYSGDSNFIGSTSSNLPQMVNQAATSTVVTSSANPSAPDDPLSFTATVSAVSPGAGTPTGSVTFLDGGFQIGTCPVSNGTATFEIPFALTVKSHTITAVYTGDSNFAGGTSLALTQVVKQTTITTTSSALSASVFGQSVTLTASVSRSGTTLVPTGTLTFLDGGTVLGTSTLNGTGRATYTTTSFSVGSQVITVVYGGDVNFFGSTSDPVFLTVSQASTCTAVTSSLNPAAAGQAISFTAVVSGQWSVVSGQWPSGVLTFQDGGTPLGTVAINGSGAATFSTTTINAGRHTISAVYGGDSGFAGSTSVALTQTVLPVATVNIPTTFNGGIGSSIAVPVNLDRSDSLEQVDLAISYDTSRLEILSAGDIQRGTLTSTFDGFVANYDNTAGTVRLSTYRSVGAIFGFGSGSVAIIHFHIKTAALPGAAIINLQPHVQTTPTVLHGSDATGAALGNFTLQPAPSDAAGDALDGLITVLPSTLTTVVSSLNPATVGQTVGFTATVSSIAGIPTGTVTFLDGSSTLATVVLDGSGMATFTTNGLTVDGHSITAVYGGDTGFPGSTSAAVFQTIQAATLRVNALTTTATGFQAVFDRLLDTSSLNLYDNSTGTLGPEDVTLTGSVTGQIRGSLVVDTVAGQQRITFIETGQAGVLGSAASGTLFGVLPDGTYTVTLRSATNGFQDTNGNMLDGNGDGTAGDDFVTTFVVNNPPNAVVVSLPDFARSGAGGEWDGGDEWNGWDSVAGAQ